MKKKSELYKENQNEILRKIIKIIWMIIYKKCFHYKAIRFIKIKMVKIIHIDI